ncbi:MAG: GIY-YIG nuclease family protein [Patescibacteria group bacterium]
MWYTYVLQSLKDEKFYIGSTEDLEARINKHNTGQNISTKHRIPFVLVYREIYDTKEEAVRREFKIKSYKGGVAFKRLISRAGTQVVNEGRL